MITATDKISGLQPDTIYYYRLSAQGTFGTVLGGIEIFKTVGNGIVVTHDETPANSTKQINNETGSKIVSKNVSMKITSSSANVSKNNNVTYDLNYQNKSGQDLSNAILRITLPKEILFKKTSIGTYSDVSRIITVNIGNIAKNADESVSIDVEIGKDAKIGDILVTTAEMVYTKANGDQENSLAYVANTIKADSNSQTASSIFGNGSFLPTSLLGWAILAFVILGLMFLGRKLYAKKGHADQVHH